ncbi:hypothetical protein [Nocardioides flavescens]|uniref:Double zinc ribbon n=1 Tax=Nocardioides flavescens TaxID=2691959 RepID=A0A6L7ENB7_9ACTN|nr:hypothetical protein [Nocardioides flavescens]MXG88817.1 hypothetical protein [Nocardioides flavescens]
MSTGPGPLSGGWDDQSGDARGGRHAASGDAVHDEVTFDPEPTQAQPIAVQPAAVEAAHHGSTDEVVTCPECGTRSQVALNRRRSQDFCPRCDYPLFWTPSTILTDGDAADQASLRRLPGTAGRVTVASRTCPHCSESNQLTALTCVRCGGLMDPPAPEPVFVAPTPAPVVEPEPEPRRTPWWMWIGGVLTLLVLIALIVYLVG